MVRILTIFFAFFIASQALGQLASVNTDSLIQNGSNSIDQRFAAEHNKLDSMERRVAQYYDSIGDFNFVDSLKTSITSRRHKLDSLENKYQAQLQELTNLKLPPNKLNDRIDSLNRAQQNVFSRINGKVDKLEMKVQEKLNDVKERLTGRIKPARDSLGLSELTNPNVSAVALENQNFSNIQDGLKVDSGIGIPKEINDQAISSELKIDDPLTGIKSDLNNSISSPKNELQELVNIDEVGKANNVAGGIKEVSSEIAEYSEDISKISKGEESEKLKKLAEEKALSVGGLNELNRNEKKLTALKLEHDKQMKLFEQYKDKDFIRNQLNQKSKNIANEELLAKNEKVQEATKNLGKYKKKYSEIQSIHDLPKRPPNPLKGKPIRDRMLPGVVIQFQKTDLLSVYLSPQVNYHLTKKWMTGGGMTFRFRGTINDSLTYVNGNFIYGFKTYLNFKVFKGFGIRGEWEPLRVPLPLDDKNAPLKKWVHGYFLGLDKTFTINRRWKGDTQVLYNLGYQEGETPYSNKVNFRVGFFLDMTRKQRLPGM